MVIAAATAAKNDTSKSTEESTPSAIQMEEIIPMGVSEATAVAPHEVYSKAATRSLHVVSGATSVGTGGLVHPNATTSSGKIRKGLGATNLKGGDGKIGHGVLVSAGEMAASERRAARRAAKAARKVAMLRSTTDGTFTKATEHVRNTTGKRQAAEDLARAGVKAGRGVTIGGGVGSRDGSGATAKGVFSKAPTASIVGEKRSRNEQQDSSIRYGSSGSVFNQLQESKVLGDAVVKRTARNSDAHAKSAYAYKL